MHMSEKNLIKAALFALIPVFTLTACTGKDEIVFEQEMPSGAQEAEYRFNEEAASDAENEDVSETIAGEPETVYVHICGAVIKPGVYELDEGSRVFEGIEAAGGFSEDACKDYVNQAKVLQDGQRLIIPTLEEAEVLKENGSYQEIWEDEASETEYAADADGLININTADESELSSIDGIGAGKAAAIVRYRQENGYFKAIQDIMNVSGIKEGTYEKIKEKITVK